MLSLVVRRPTPIYNMRNRFRRVVKQQRYDGKVHIAYRAGRRRTTTTTDVRERSRNGGDKIIIINKNNASMAVCIIIR